MIGDILNSTTDVSCVETVCDRGHSDSTTDVSRMEAVVIGDILNSYNRRQPCGSCFDPNIQFKEQRALPNRTVYVK